MRKASLKKPVIYPLVLLQLSMLCSGAPVPPEADRQRARMGILRMGETPTLSAEQAYPIVESRVRHWLENQGSLHAFVEPIGGSVAAETILLESESNRLSQVTDRLNDALSAGKDAGRLEGIVEEMRRSRTDLPFASRYSPLIQRSLVAEAGYLWREGKKDEALHEVDRAARLHPDGKVDGVVPWDEISPDFGLAVEAAAKKARSGGNQSCLLDLNVTPEYGRNQYQRLCDGAT